MQLSFTAGMCLLCPQLNQKNMTLSNRCQVFDRFQDTISQHVVKVDFLNRIHKKHPPNRRMLQSVKRRSLKVSHSPAQAGWWSLPAFLGRQGRGPNCRGED